MYKILIPKDTDKLEDLKVLLKDIEADIQDLNLSIKEEKERSKKLINKMGEDIFKDMPNPLLELLNYKRRLKKEVTRRIKDLENGGNRI